LETEHCCTDSPPGNWSPHMTELAQPTISTPTPPADTERSGPRHLGLTLLAVALGVMMVALDGTVVSVANPTIQRDLHASLSGLQWVTNGYLLALAVALITGGKLGDLFGRRLVFSIGVVGFALASLGCALSGSIAMLVVFRVIQGLAGALLMPNTLAILRATFPADQLTKAVGIWGATSALAVASGPIVGGLLVEHVSWESIFLLNLPLGAITLVTTAAVVAESREPDVERRFDFPGLALLSAGLFLVVWALIKAQSHAWLSAYVLGFGIAGLVCLAAFAVRESRASSPMLPLDIFRSRSVSAGTALAIIGFIGLFGVLFFITLYLQNVHGYSPIQTGVKMLPLTATFIVSPILGSVLTERLGPRWPLMAGMLILGGAFLGLTGLGVSSAYSDLWPWFVLIGLALGLIITATTQAVVGNVSVDRGGVAGGLQSTAQQLGGVLGTSILGSIIVSSVGSVLAGKLAANGVHGGVAAAVLAHKDLVGSGIAPVSAQMSPALRDAVTHASDAAFLHGLHTAMIVGAGLSIAAALVAPLVQRGDDVAPEHAAGV
jgi:EmrB/QacA subfamily drug resistance transporter